MTRKTEDQSQTKAAPEELSAEDLEQAQGGIGMLLPAVQKVRDAAVRTTTSSITGGTGNIVAGDGSV